MNRLLKFYGFILLIICVGCEEGSDKNSKHTTKDAPEAEEKLSFPEFPVRDIHCTMTFPVKFEYNSTGEIDSEGIEKHIYNFDSDSLKIALITYNFADSSKTLDTASLKPTHNNIKTNMDRKYDVVEWKVSESDFLEDGGFYGKLLGRMKNNGQISVDYYKIGSSQIQLMTYSDSLHHDWANFAIESLEIK